MEIGPKISEFWQNQCNYDWKSMDRFVKERPFYKPLQLPCFEPDKKMFSTENGEWNIICHLKSTL